MTTLRHSTLLILIVINLSAIQFSHGYLGKIVGGFTQLDTWQDKTIPQSPPLTYFVSVEPAIQGNALESCKYNFQGDLLTIQSRAQLDFVAGQLKNLEIETASGFWTAGKKSESKCTWLTNGKVIATPDLYWHTNHSTKAHTETGLKLLVDGPKPGYCVADPMTFQAKFVCQVDDSLI